ncbi:unnamed protein product [Caenorhabditis sp. 36 PRJEB53466]|nr:unnamed protein product [Caenorhabditis sp. 36 PRJEB53466]
MSRLDSIDWESMINALNEDLAYFYQTVRDSLQNDDNPMLERWNDLMERPNLSADKKSMKALKLMEKESVANQDKNATCTICIDELCNTVELPEEHVIKPEMKMDVKTFCSTIAVMPCKHRYHIFCLTLWLEKEQSCPTCRQKVKSDTEYEEEERKKNIEELHDSMYS